MAKTTHTPLNSFYKGQGKDKHFNTQMKCVFAAFRRKLSTMLMVSVESGVMRSNICYYVAELRKYNAIRVVRMGICPISKHGGVQYLTTNSELFPKSHLLTSL
jgi:hypothetical protein